MQKVMNVMRKNSGYIAIEAVIVAGLVLALGALSLSKFNTSAVQVTDSALTKVQNAVTQGSQGQ